MAQQLRQDFERRTAPPENFVDLNDTDETAKRLGVSSSFLNKARLDGSGPPFVKLGKAVRYDWPVVRAWIATRTRHSTSEAA